MIWPGTEGPLTKESILKVVSHVYGTTEEVLKTRNKTGGVRFARHTYFWICKQFLYKATHQNIANYVCRSSHNASMNSVMFINNCIDNNNKHGSEESIIKKLKVCLFLLRLNYDI